MTKKNTSDSKVGDIEEAYNRVRKHNFSGNRGQAIKNSYYFLLTTLVGKIGSLVFTIFIARLLMPELFGLYGIALSTIILFSSFSDLGISTALLTFMSKKFGNKELSKEKGYYEHLLKYKVILLSSVSIVLLASSYFVANYYYHKPIFLTLLIGAIYIPAVGLVGYFGQVFAARNNFRMGLVKEIIIQVTRLTIVPLVILLLIGKIQTQFLLMLIFLSLSLAYTLAALFLYVRIKKADFFKVKTEKLSKSEKSELAKFVLPLSVTALSGMFFGSIDMIMLGRFVASEFVGFYQSSFSLISSASAIVAFSGTALFPILAKLGGKRLERGFKKSVRITAIVAILAAIFTYLFSETIILLIYGAEYSNSILLLKLFSLMLFSTPIIAMYSSYYISQKNTRSYAGLLILSTILNIVLNYILITSFISRGMMAAVVGACIATIISNYIYLIGLIVLRKKVWRSLKGIPSLGNIKLV
ncbi:oligosaccharide flippase family protein [archaeon]|jgi:stage V sporulation protein B|nr:oligosaccharide flippase family protein [archaeon]MBT3578289.1 oligosaccharide flippase family protein [archaeon]MBT6819790.1 oligosaccharide flippase family protein [archaeon]MBT6955815.1 oligosaccharide flippase family protein [archaeon]MBT7025572.1 oligosaccharide flippase family protein [archaeon]